MHRSLPVSAYAELWESLYKRDSQREAGLQLRVRTIEWHADFEAIWPVLEPYLMGPAAHALDVGCGTSALSLHLMEAGAIQRLTLLDASPTVVEQLKRDHAHNPHVKVLTADCRSIPLPDRCCDILLDKGTLDALDTDQERCSMMREMTRLLSGPQAVIVSVAFASRNRRAWFEAQCLALQLEHHTHLLGPGDPHEGHEVRWLFLAGHTLCAPYTPSALTSKLLARLASDGSFHDYGNDDTVLVWDVLDEHGDPHPM